MALINCGECGREISDKSTVCIGCGAPVTATFSAASEPAKPVPKNESRQSEEKYFVLIEDNESGPHTLAKLHEMWSKGEIWEGTLFAQSGMEEWKPLSEILSKIKDYKKKLPKARETISPLDSNQSQYKCEHCFGIITFGINRLGEKIFCPHCQRDTVLRSISHSNVKPHKSQFQSPKKCPYCSGEIPVEAVKCKHCGSSVSTLNKSPTEARDPLLMAVYSGCCLAGMGQMVLGQTGKGFVMLLGSVAVAVITGGIGALVLWPLNGIDAYMVASAMKKGKPVGAWDFFPSN
jgi:hypothetical protein